MEEVRGYLDWLRQQPDPDHRVAIAMRSEWPDDLVIRLMQIHKELSFDYEGVKRTDVAVIDLLWAVDFLDHLDTLGLSMTTKPYVKSH